MRVSVEEERDVFSGCCLLVAGGIWLGGGVGVGWHTTVEVSTAWWIPTLAWLAALAGVIQLHEGARCLRGGGS